MYLDNPLMNILNRIFEDIRERIEIRAHRRYFISKRVRSTQVQTEHDELIIFSKLESLFNNVGRCERVYIRILRHSTM